VARRGFAVAATIDDEQETYLEAAHG